MGLTIVSPIPRLKIPAKGARARSLYPEDNQIGRAHPSKSEKWLGKRKFCHERELNAAVYQKHSNMGYSEKSRIPDNEKIRVTVIGECIHELIYWLS